jgi:Zn finger protein HypA/HybF involved in hydrogenase expression
MSHPSQPAVEECTQCGAMTPLGEIIFNEPDEENTQYGWLMGVCPKCDNDLKVSYERVTRDLASRD